MFKPFRNVKRCAATVIACSLATTVVATTVIAASNGQESGTAVSDLPAVSGDALSIYARNAKATARQYKSLQLDLTFTNNTVDDYTTRFPDNGVVKNDKTIDPLFDNLIDRNIMDNFLAPYTDKTYDSGATGNTPETARVVVIDNDTTYTPGFTYGVIIATGDVNLNSGFTGMILSGGKVTISAGTYSSDELMVSKLFEDDALRGHDATFTTMFPTYNNLSANVLGVVQVQDYIGYDNWTKYAD